MASGGADLQLWHDWCAAAQIDPDRATPAQLDRFVATTCHSRTLKYRRAAAVRQHLGLDRPAAPPPQPFDPADLLTGMPRTGWPAGLNRTRDAFIVVCSSLGLTRAQIQQLTPLDVDVAGARPQVRGRPAPTHPEIGRCGACAVIDWLALTAATTGGGRGEAQLVLTRPLPATHRHTLTDRRWQSAHQLLPAFDLHGWPDHTRPISIRTISTALHRPPADVAAPVAIRTTTWAGRRRDDRLEQLLDQLDNEADTAYDQVAAIMRSVGLTPDQE